VAGRKFGKSTLALAELLRSAQTKKNNVYVAPTYKMARNTLWMDHIEKFVPQEMIKEKNNTDLSLKLVNGNGISLYGADNPDRLRGLNIDFVVLDEFQDIKPDSWELVIEPNLLSTKGRALFMGTPKGLRNILCEQYRIKDKSFSSYHFTSYDNPLNSRELLDSRKKRLIEAGKVDVWNQEYMAMFTEIAGLVYKNWDPSIHIKDMDIADGSFGISIDRGVKNPSAVGFYYCYEKGGETRIHLFDEIYESELSSIALVEKIRNKMGNRYFAWKVCDPSARDFMSTAADMGLVIQPANRQIGGNKGGWVLNGISLCQDWLSRSKIDGQPKFTVSPRCKNFIHEIETYIWDEQPDRERNEKDRPRKLNDHAVDQWRYFICSFKRTKSPFRRVRVHSYGRITRLGAFGRSR